MKQREQLTLVVPSAQLDETNRLLTFELSNAIQYPSPTHKLTLNLLLTDSF
eukprot:m.3393 g.3393  ORF g.3393 m.3393 type:complete len:51 (-) comp4059_c0_seq1:8-160(-)